MDYIYFKDKVVQLIEQRKKLHPNDEFHIYKYWEEISSFMSINEGYTTQFLNECDKETVDWLSEIFEDLSEKLKSKNIILVLENLDNKFPDLNLSNFVKSARHYL